MDINQKTLNYLKSITAETISNAKSGHTGSALGASSIMLALFRDHLLFDPKNPNFLNRDRVVLSAGHTSGMFYSLLHMFGYDVSIENLKNFRKYHSATPGHPEVGVTPGVETSTGPLGQGIANAVGLAIGQTMFASRFNTKQYPLFTNYTYCYAGDGCLMEGVGMEACSLAGTLALNNLILLYDYNNITIDGVRSLSNTEDTAKKFESMGWDVVYCKNGQDIEACSKAIKQAKGNRKPTIVIFNTTIGIGTRVAGTNKAHAYPIPTEELQPFKDSIDAPESFYIPEDVYSHCKTFVDAKLLKINSWKTAFEQYKSAEPEKFKELKKFTENSKINFEKILKTLLKEPVMTGRDASALVLNEIAKAYPSMIGGTADLGPSTKAVISDGGAFSAENRLGRNIHFGVREHAMGSICNGIALYTHQPVFDSTFLAFSNYMSPATRMRTMMNLPIVSVFTHDSVDIGQDGPTHQPIEQIGWLRQIPNNMVFRPATKTEIVGAWKWFIENKLPASMILSKSKLPLECDMNIDDTLHGAYVIYETKTKPQIQIIATGKEVELAVSVAKEFEHIGVRVISMPCEKLFATQDKTYKNKTLLKSPILKVVIEASNDPIWFKYAGENGLIINVETYQFSGPGSEVYKNAGFTLENIKKQIEKKLK